MVDHLRSPQGPKRIQDDRDIDGLLDERTLDRAQIPERGCHHSGKGHEEPGPYALERDALGIPGDRDCRQKPVEAIDQDDDIGGFGGGSGPGRPKRHAEIGGGERRRVVHAIADPS